MRGGWIVLSVLLGLSSAAHGSFVNWETPHVSPLAMTSDGSRLLAVNTPDNRLEVFDLTSGLPVLAGSIPVGLDPVSVRARTDDEVWVVNHISDSVSIVDLPSGSVVATIQTLDEPADVVFAGVPERAFVSCSQLNRVQVFDPTDPGEPLATFKINGEDPRAMAVSADGSEVYVAIFESGNASTILSGGTTALFSPLADQTGPYGGENPPPNVGDEFVPPQNPLNPDPPRVSLIVKKGANGLWMDDNNGNWTPWISGLKSFWSERPVGWDMPDRDVAVIDADTLAVDYVHSLMNLNMALAVNPATGDLTVVGTDGINEVRFEPNLNGVFLRVNAAVVDPDNGSSDVLDLNPHLDYSIATLPPSERAQSIGDPRGIAWNAAGTKAYVTGMGSNNVVAIDENGLRTGSPPIEVGEGPTGIVLDEARQQLYVINKFAASISTVRLSDETEIARLDFFDPSPTAIKVGRRHLYDTHETSGLGHLSCASCHVDARIDRLAWELGNPAGEMKDSSAQNLGRWNELLDSGFDDAWHPMKGPMVTQTLQDIIGKEPHHWRGDRDGLEEFNQTFDNLQGDDNQLTDAEMQEFEDFLATIHFPPNPHRLLDNSFSTDLVLEFQFSTGKFSPRGTPLPNGNAARGLELFRPPNFLDTPFSCNTCHTLPSGVGTSYELIGNDLVEIPKGPNGEAHSGLVSVDGDRQRNLVVPHLRNLYERIGYDVTQMENNAGFGFAHDGVFDSLATFFRLGFPGIQSDQDLADVIALMLSFSGSDMPEQGGGRFEPPGPPSLDAHAAVGKQITVVDPGALTDEERGFVQAVAGMAQQNVIDLVAKGIWQGELRGYFYVGDGLFQSDRLAETLTPQELVSRAGAGTELTITVVPEGSGVRIGIDRDEDGVLDGDEG